MFCVFRLSWLFLLGCQYQWKWLTGKSRLRNDLFALMGTLNPTHSVTRPIVTDRIFGNASIFARKRVYTAAPGRRLIQRRIRMTLGGGPDWDWTMHQEAPASSIRPATTDHPGASDVFVLHAELRCADPPKFHPPCRSTIRNSSSRSAHRFVYRSMKWLFECRS